MHVARYLGLTLEAEQAWIDALALVARRHPTEPDICEGARLLSSWAQDHLHTLGPITERFGLLRSLSANALRKALFGRRRAGTLGLLRDLQDLYLLATQTRSCWTVLRQAARALHDGELERTAEYCGGETMRALAWLDTKIHQTTPQAVTVPAASQTETLALPANHPGLAAIAEVLCLSLRRPSLLVAVMLGAGGGTVVGLRGWSRASLRRAIPVLALNMAFVAFLLDRGRAGRVARSSSVAAPNAGLRGIQPTMTLES